MKKESNIDRISEALKDNAERIFSGSARARALRDVWFKSRYLSSLFEVSNKNSLDLSKARILDVGCSKCDVLLAMQKLGINSLTGLNLSPFKLEWLSSKVYYEQYFGDSVGKIKYVVCDVDTESFPLEDSSYDVVLSINVLEHLHDPERVLLECHRVLSLGGLMVLGTPNVANLRNRLFAVFGRSIYYPLDKWLTNSQRRLLTSGKMRRFIGHTREYTMKEIDFMMRKYGFQVLLRRYFTSYPLRGQALHRLYTFLERLYPRFAYNMLIIGAKMKDG